MEYYITLIIALVFAIPGTALADGGEWSVSTWIPIAAGIIVSVVALAICATEKGKKKKEYDGAHDEKDNIEKRQDNTKPCCVYTGRTIGLVATIKRVIFH
ncbi:protein PXR1, partial [Biomphalaria pfeifferi]